MSRRLVLLFLITCVKAHGQPPSPEAALTLDACIRKALAVPSALSVARLDRSIADRDHSIARAGLLPQAAATVAGIYTSPSQVTPDAFAFVAANAVRQYTGVGRIFLELDTSGRVRAEIARARAGQQAAQASSGIAERDLKRAVAQAYYRLLLARRLVEAINSSLVESQTFAQRVRLLAEGGEASRADVVKAATQVAILRQTLSSAELAATLANQDLAAWWTPDVDTLLRLEDVFDAPLSEPPPPASPPGQFMRRLEFSLLDAQKTTFQADARRTKALLRPQLALNFDYGLDSYRVNWQNRGYSAMASVNFPLFDWFRTANAARQFTLKADQITATRSIAERRYSQEYSAALARTTSLREQILQAKEQVTLAEEDYKLSRIRYEGGEGPAVDVVVAQTQLVQGRSSYYVSISNYLSAKLDLEVAAGK